MTAARVRAITPKVTPEIVNVSPKLAEQWLAGNTVNRTIREAVVVQYATDMAEGRWTLGGDAICFSPEGLLLNGQHRLNAISLAEVTVPMLVLRNVPIDAMGNMDTGAKRSAADFLGFHGETHSAALAAALKFAVLYTSGRLYKDTKVQRVSHGEMLEFLEENPDLRESVTFIYSHCRPIDLKPTSKIIGHWLFARATTPYQADEFFHLLATRTDLPKGSPILALDSRIREMRKQRVSTSARDELFLLVKAWNYWRTGRRVSTLAAKPKSGEVRIPDVAR